MCIFTHKKMPIANSLFRIVLPLSNVSSNVVCPIVAPPHRPHPCARQHTCQVTFYGAGTMATGTNAVEPFLVFELMEFGALRGLLASQRVLYGPT